jgi:hypothetical protein
MYSIGGRPALNIEDKLPFTGIMMPRTAICVICAMLASIAAALLLLAPSPAIGQDEQPQLTSEVTLGGALPEGATPLKVTATLKMLGGEDAVPGFKLLVHAKYAGKPHEKATCLTSDKGTITITLNTKADELRVFAFGDYLIPDGWSNIPVSALKADEPNAWELRVRSLKDVQITGRISLEGSEAKPGRANVSFAPLDVAQDGSSRLFDQPISVLTDDEGRYRVNLPTGYYQTWSYWTDRTTNDWVGYIKVENQVSVFADQTMNLTLRRGPQLKGKVIDARTGKGIAASIDLYSNLYLRQLRNPSADGFHADAYDEEDNPILWPIGTFNFQAWSINPDDFTVVIKPQGSEAVTKVIPNQSGSQLEGKEIEWKLFTEDMPQVDIKVTTHEQDLPVMELDIKLLPKKIDVPQHIQQTYSAGASTDADGVARFLGLADGTYEAFGASGTMFLGEISVGDKAKQQITLEFKIPFAYGSVKLPDGELCKNMVAFIKLVKSDGREYGPYRNDAFRDNPKLKERGMVFVPLLDYGSTFKVRFAAMTGGREFTDDDWVEIENFNLVTDELEFKIDAEKGYKVDLTLKPNPYYKKLKD